MTFSDFFVWGKKQFEHFEHFANELWILRECGIQNKINVFLIGPLSLSAARTLPHHHDIPFPCRSAPRLMEAK